MKRLLFISLLIFATQISCQTSSTQVKVDPITYLNPTQQAPILQQQTVRESFEGAEKNSAPEDTSNTNSDQSGAASEESGDESGHTTNIPGIGLGIIFIFGSLLYGSILKTISRYTSIPYNPLLLISGITLGIYHKHLGMLGQSISLISTASPIGILAIFLPMLIFESAFRTQWHVFKKLAAQSLILGILSSIVSATLIMFFIQLFIDSQSNFYDWDEAFMMGSILSCTDILSFVHKLKRGGTPQKLTSLLQGESLFNYCTCVLIVQLLHYHRQIKQLPQFEGFWQYLKLLLIQIGGGIVFGVAVGIIAVYCIKRMIYDGVLVVTLMVILTYSTYLLAQFSAFRISGITSLAVFALYMNAFAKTWLFGETEEYVNSFWSYLVFIGQTNIFMIAGVMVGSALLHLKIEQETFHFYNQVFITIYIYLFVVFARFVSISVFIKYLKKLGEGLNWKQIFLLTFSGLKGGIGIALAMQTFKNKDFAQSFSYLIMIHVTSNSLITLIIHGTSASLVVKLLGLSSLKKVEYKFFKEYLFSFKASVHERMQNMKAQASQGNMIEWDQVQVQIGLPTYINMAKETDDIIANKQFNDQSKFQKSQMFKLQHALKDHVRGARPSVSNISQQLLQKNALFDLEVEFRKRFLKDLIAKYWEFHDANETTPAALMLLIQSANYDLDRSSQEIQSWKWIKNQITFNMRIFSQLMKVTFINELAKSSLFQYVSFCYDVVSSYIKANQEVREELFIFYQKSQHRNQDQQRVILLNILRESEQNQKQAQFFLINYLQPSFPQIQKEVKTRKVSFFILHTFKDIIDKNNQNGQLQPNEYDMLNHIIDSKSLSLNLSNPKWEQSDLFQILSEDKERNVFKGIPGPILQLISNSLGQKFTFDANERIIDNNEIAKYVFFVKKGGCIVEFTNQNLVYKEPMLAGQVFGFQSLLTNLYHSKTTANTMAQIIQVKKGLLLKIFDTFPHIEQAFWKNNIFQCYKMFVKKDDISDRISHIHKEDVEEMVATFKLKLIQPKTIEDPEVDMIFIRGNMEFTTKEDNKSRYSFTQKHSSKDKENQIHEGQSSYTEQATPFYFVSRLKQVIIRIKEPSLFLIGELDYQIFERVSIRLSRNSIKTKKKTTVF